MQTKSINNGGYKELMKKCWDADLDKRPDIKTLWSIVYGINKSLHENDSHWNNTASPLNSMFNKDNVAMSSLVEDPYNPRSKIFNFNNNLPNFPKNLTIQNKNTNVQDDLSKHESVNEDRSSKIHEKEQSNEDIMNVANKSKTNSNKIGHGALGFVESADYVDNQRYALKSFYRFDDATVKAIAHELKLHREVGHFDNIIRFYGITIYDEESRRKKVRKCSLVLELADGGSFRDYLAKNIDRLAWNNKYILAHQLACAVHHLHEKGIVHRDLHSGNILVHQYKIKLADFGLSRRIDEGSRLISKLFGLVPYVDPKGDTYKNYDKESRKLYDVFSLGVLFWEISSGHPPFKDRDYDQFLMSAIAAGTRETIIDGTPVDYYKLYTECWDDEPSNRPTTSQVVKRLNQNINEGSERQSNEDSNDNDITVHIDGPPSKYVLVNLNPEDNLSKIRERLEQNSIVGMNDMLSFININCSSLDRIASEDEEGIKLKEIIKNEVLYLKYQDYTDITVQILSNRLQVPLNIQDNLSKIRKVLGKLDKVRMEAFLFAIQINNSISTGSSLARVAREDEEKIILFDIIDKRYKILYLKLELNWENKFKLKHGRTIFLDKAIVEADKRAFIITEDYCIQAIDQFTNNTIEISSEEDMLLTVNIDVSSLAKLVGNLKIEKSDTRINSTYNVIEYSKMSLKFNKLEPTQEFLDAVSHAIDSNNPKNFKKITDEFGQFISKEIILGGRAYFRRPNILKESFEEYDICNNGDINNSGYECFKLVGGKQCISFKGFDKKAWVESLNDFRNWSCIKFKNPISIFQPLSEKLHKQILFSVGKQILYARTEDFNYKLSEPGKCQIFKLKNIPEDILEVLQNKNADCSIFATVIDTKEMKNDIFNCQILWPLNEDPELIIHCIQKKNQRT